MISSLLVKPVISEKSLKDQAKGKYAFYVLRGANKNQIKAVVEKFFKVNVLKVWIKKKGPETKKMGKKKLSKIYPAQKIAVVQLAKDQKIQILEMKDK